jgi:hypothetical protein
MFCGFTATEGVDGLAVLRCLMFCSPIILITSFPVPEVPGVLPKSHYVSLQSTRPTTEMYSHDRQQTRSARQFELVRILVRYTFLKYA